MFTFLKSIPFIRPAFTVDSTVRKEEPAATAASVLAPIPVVETTPAVISAPTMEAYVAACGFTFRDHLTGKYDEVIPIVKSVAKYIAKHQAEVEMFLAYLRGRLLRDRNIFFHMDKLSEEAQKTTIIFAREVLAPHGLISNLYINYDKKSISAEVPPAKRVIDFLSGGWLEVWTRDVVESTISALAAEHEMGYEIYSNAVVADDTVAHELDVVFRMGTEGRLCMVECKSGKTDFALLHQVADDLSAIPSHTLLVSAPSTDKAADAIAYFHNIDCCNTNRETLVSRVRDMAERSIRACPLASDEHRSAIFRRDETDARPPHV